MGGRNRGLIFGGVFLTAGLADIATTLDAVWWAHEIARDPEVDQGALAELACWASCLHEERGSRRRKAQRQNKENGLSVIDLRDFTNSRVVAGGNQCGEALPLLALMTRSTGQANGRSITLTSRHIPCAPVEKLDGIWDAEVAQENVSWHIFTLAIQGE